MVGTWEGVGDGWEGDCLLDTGVLRLVDEALSGCIEVGGINNPKPRNIHTI